ncbi:MAG: hypothetical protein WA254_14850 [Candidatus Sulfotelmatobacter sp.]
MPSAQKRVPRSATAKGSSKGYCRKVQDHAHLGAANSIENSDHPIRVEPNTDFQA